MKWQHDALADDLAGHLRASGDRAAWTNMQLGPSGTCRPDVYAIAKSYAHFQVDAYECKVSTTDLRHDLTTGKWQKYRAYAHRVWFAVPKGLSIDDIPRECGVIVRHEQVWRAARKPVSIPLETLPHDTWIKLIIDGLCREVTFWEPRPRSRNSWDLVTAARKKFGDEVADLLQSRRSATNQYEMATEALEKSAEEASARAADIVRAAGDQARRQTDRLNEAQRELAVAVGLSADCPITELVATVHNLASVFDSNFGIERTIKSLQALQSLKVAA